MADQVSEDTADALKRLTAEIERLRASFSPPPALLSFRKAAKLLGIDRGSTLQALIKSGQIKCVKAGRTVRIPLSEINRLAVQGFEELGPKAAKARSIAATAPSAWKLRP